MAWYSDEEYVFRQDCREKKNVAASAFKKRTHCGKSGKARFPHEYLTKKELEKMNGECKSYQLNKPMDWETFKSMPDDLKVEYINWIRDEFGAPGAAIADMFNIHHTTCNAYIRALGIRSSENKNWNKRYFQAWLNGVDYVEPEKSDIKISISPMKWDEFKDLTVEESAAYVSILRDTFGATNKAIAGMLGVSCPWLSRYLNNLGINLDKSLLNSHRDWDKDGFQAWCDGVDENVEIEEKSPEIRMVEEIDDPEIAEKLVDALEKATENCGDAIDVSKPNVCSLDHFDENEIHTLISEVDISDTTEVLLVALEESMNAENTPAEPDVEALDNWIDHLKNRSEDEKKASIVVPETGHLTFDCEADKAFEMLRGMLGDTRVQLSVSWTVADRDDTCARKEE